MNLRTPIIIKFQNPFIPSWKSKMIEYAKAGKSFAAVKEIKNGKNCSLREAKDLWDTKYKSKYYNRI